MPEEARLKRRRFTYSALRGGFSSVEPYRLQSPDLGGEIKPLVNAQNMIWHRGALRSAWKWTAMDGAAHVNPQVDGNIASRQETTDTNAQYVVGGSLFSTTSSNRQAYVILTDGEVYVNGASMNPTYSTGTSTYLGVGTGTAWQARGIKVADLFKLDSDTIWRVIDGVTGDTALSTVSNPGTGSGNYKIRRTFARGSTPGRAMMVELNGDLYVACQGGGVDPGGESNWCVLKVADIFGTPTEATYVMATWNVTGALPAKSILSGVTSIAGIQASDSGHIVLLAEQDGAPNRVLWCSPRDSADWTGEEAGFRDLVPSRGEGRCLCRIGERLVAYFVDSVHLGEPTGLVEAPYTWKKTAVEVGTRWYRGACEAVGGNLYVGSDGHFYFFDGERSLPLTDDTIRRWTRGSDETYFMDVRVPVSPAIADAAVSVGAVVVA